MGPIVPGSVADVYNSFYPNVYITNILTGILRTECRAVSVDLVILTEWADPTAGLQFDLFWQSPAQIA